MMKPMRTKMKVPRIVPKMMKRFFVGRFIPGILEVVVEGAAIEDVGDVTGFASENDEVIDDDVVDDVVDDALDEEIVVVDEAEGESMELSSDSPISSSCSKLLLVVAAALVVAADVVWAIDILIVPNSTTITT
jgi:hypothetical protein